MDRLGPGQAELALAGGRDGRDQEPDRRELAAQMREAWDAHQGRDEIQEAATPDRERETPQAFAARLRAAFKVAAASPEFSNACAQIEAPLMYLDGPDYAKYVEATYRKETQLIDRLKLKELMAKG